MAGPPHVPAAGQSRIEALLQPTALASRSGPVGCSCHGELASASPTKKVPRRGFPSDTASSCNAGGWIGRRPVALEVRLVGRQMSGSRELSQYRPSSIRIRRSRRAHPTAALCAESRTVPPCQPRFPSAVRPGHIVPTEKNGFRGVIPLTRLRTSAITSAAERFQETVVLRARSSARSGDRVSGACPK